MANFIHQLGDVCKLTGEFLHEAGDALDRRLTLVHGRYNPSLEAIVQDCSHRLWRRRVDFYYGLKVLGPDGLESGFAMPSPAFAYDPGVAVVLEVTLGTFEETFEFAWEWACAGTQHGGRRYDLRCPDEIKLGDLRPLDEFRPNTRRWRRIKLDAHQGKKPIAVRDPRISPGLGVLFAAAQHPFFSVNTKKVRCWYLPGLEYAGSDNESRRHLPYICHDRDTVSMHEAKWDDDYDWKAVPVYWE